MDFYQIEKHLRDLEEYENRIERDLDLAHQCCEAGGGGGTSRASVRNRRGRPAPPRPSFCDCLEDIRRHTYDQILFDYEGIPQTPHSKHGGQNDILGKTCEAGQNVVGVDWVTLTGKQDDLPKVNAILLRWFGAESEACTPLQFYRKGRSWSDVNVRFFWEHTSGGWQVLFSGESFNLLGQSKAFDLIREIHQETHCKFTRIDLRTDYRGECVTILDDAFESTKAGHVRRFRVDASPIMKMSLDGGDPRLETMYFGSAQSNKRLRIYDKGLEQKQQEKGKWIRFEGVYKKAYADALGMVLFNSPDLSIAMSIAKRYLLAIIDFRVGPRGDGVSVERLPRATWWEKLLDGIDTVCVKVERVKPSLISRLRWLRESVARSLQPIAQAVGCSVGDVLNMIGRDVESPIGGLSVHGSEIVKEIRSQLQDTFGCIEDVWLCGRPKCLEPVGVPF